MHVTEISTNITGPTVQNNPAERQQNVSWIVLDSSVSKYSSDVVKSVTLALIHRFKLLLEAKPTSIKYLNYSCWLLIDKLGQQLMVSMRWENVPIVRGSLLLICFVHESWLNGAELMENKAKCFDLLFYLSLSFVVLFFSLIVTKCEKCTVVAVNFLIWLFYHFV